MGNLCKPHLLNTPKLSFLALIRFAAVEFQPCHAEIESLDVEQVTETLSLYIKQSQKQFRSPVVKGGYIEQANGDSVYYLATLLPGADRKNSNIIVWRDGGRKLCSIFLKDFPKPFVLNSFKQIVAIFKQLLPHDTTAVTTTDSSGNPLFQADPADAGLIIMEVVGTGTYASIDLRISADDPK